MDLDNMILPQEAFVETAANLVLAQNIAKELRLKYRDINVLTSILKEVYAIEGMYMMKDQIQRGSCCNAQNTDKSSDNESLDIT